MMLITFLRTSLQRFIIVTGRMLVYKTIVPLFSSFECWFSSVQ